WRNFTGGEGTEQILNNLMLRRLGWCGGCSHGEENMKLRELRFIRQAAVLAVATSLLALPSVSGQGTPTPQRQTAPAFAPKTVPTPGIASTGFAGLDQYRSSRVPMLLDDYGQLARYRAADEELLKAGAVKDRVVFFGDSITDMWKLENNFAGKPYVNR